MKRYAATKSELTDERILSLGQLLERVPITRQTVWRLCREKRFPQPIHLTNSRIGWRWSSVLAWLAEREAKPIPRRGYFGADKDNKPAA